MSAALSTAREALIAELLGEVDQLVERTEFFQARVEAAERRTESLVAALGRATQSYQSAVEAFHVQARQAMRDYLIQQGRAHLARTVDEQRTALQEAAASAFSVEVTERLATLASAIEKAAQARPRSARARMVDILLTALVSAALTAAAVGTILA